MSIGLSIGSAIIAIVIVPIIGGLLKGLDRKLSARMQSRIGPPVTQAFYDVLKLFSKQVMVAGKAQLVFACAYLILIVTAVVLFSLGQDLLMVLLVFFFGSLCLPLGALSVKSPFSQLGGHRELMQSLAYEPILLLAAVPIALKTGGFPISNVFSYGQPLLPSLWLTFMALLLALIILMRKSPFDLSSSEHAHQELVRGILTEYSGPYLAIIEIAHWFELVLVLGLLALFWASGNFWWLSIFIALAGWFMILLVDNISARLNWSRMVGTAWGIGVVLIALNIVFINLGWM
jgi:ech hydrogenase subunit B